MVVANTDTNCLLCCRIMLYSIQLYVDISVKRADHNFRSMETPILEKKQIYVEAPTLELLPGEALLLRTVNMKNTGKIKGCCGSIPRRTPYRHVGDGPTPLQGHISALYQQTQPEGRGGGGSPFTAPAL